LERHIEVKGRAKGQDTITVTSNEIRHGLNQKDKFVLAVVVVDGDEAESVNYIPMPFTQEPDWAEASKNLDLGLLLGAEPWNPRCSMSKQQHHKERCPRACAAGASDRRCYLRWGFSLVLSTSRSYAGQ
jgi:hypothetical protein